MLFARHWYSTLVEVLTDKREEIKYCEKEGTTGIGLKETQNIKPPWTWQPDSMQLEIQALPWSDYAVKFYYSQPKQVSCWGEWHFAVLNGSENQELAIELVNHLMSSSAICERAASCAALPTVETFYELYPDVPCLRLPERNDIILPKLTYKELQDHIFEVAGSRRPIFDYQHCMREIHSLLSYVQHIRKVKTASDEIEVAKILAERTIAAVKRIRELNSREMMIH